MNWSSIFGSSTSREKYSPALNALEQQRLKQIESLRRFHPSVTEIKKDIEYKITFFIKDESLHLHVYLPSNFPYEAPVVTVSPAVTHPWVNDQMVVFGCDSLNKFYMHSNLGRALQDVCKQFNENPPVLRNAASASSSDNCSYTRPSPAPLIELQTSGQSSSNAQPGGEGLSDIAEHLDRCSEEELVEFNKNPEKLMKLIFDMDLIYSSKMKRDEQMALIDKIARENIEERKCRLEAARERLLSKYEKLSAVRAEFDHWSLKQNDLLEIRTRDQIHASLQIAVAQTEEESEKIAEGFLNEDIHIEEFIRMFTEKRKLTHVRHWKEENFRKF